MTRPSARTELVPDKIGHVLATEGMVQFVSGPAGAQSSMRLHVAPYDDMVVLFVNPESQTRDNLQMSTRCQILAGSVQAGWQLMMDGRAVCTGPVNSHPRRLELQHWLPEGTPGVRLLAVEFVPERIEYADGEGDERRRYQGETAAAHLPPPYKRWLAAAFSGIVLPWFLSTVALVLWFGWWGLRMRGRWIALPMTVYGVCALMGGARLTYRSVAMRRWQIGRALRRDAGVLGLGWVSQRDALWAGIVLMASAMLVALAVRFVWGMPLYSLILLLSQIWWMAPAWFLHMLQKYPEEREVADDGGMLPPRD